MISPVPTKTQLFSKETKETQPPSWKKNTCLVAADASTFWAIILKNWTQIYPKTPINIKELLKKTYLTPSITSPMLAQSIITYPLSNTLEHYIGQNPAAIISGTLSGFAETQVSQLIAKTTTRVRIPAVSCMVLRDTLYTKGFLASKNEQISVQIITPSVIATSTLPLDIIARNFAIGQQPLDAFISKAKSSLGPRVMGVNLSLGAVLCVNHFWNLNN